MQTKFSDGQSKFSQVFNFAIIGYSRNSQKLYATEKLVFYSISTLNCRHLAQLDALESCCLHDGFVRQESGERDDQTEDVVYKQ